MTLVAEHPNPIAVLDAVIADMRASGDTGHVENLLQARADFVELAETQRETLRMLEAAHRQLGMWTDSNKRIQRAKAALARIGSTP